MSTQLNASRPTGRRRRLKTYGEARVCRDEGCSTRLSKYNRNPECHTHALRRFPRTRGVLGEPTAG
jgi:hypothetical protein